MTYHFKAQLLDEKAVARALTRIAHEILERNQGSESLCLVGICRRGVDLAKAIGMMIRQIDGSEIPVGSLDITLYRDDLTAIAETAQINSTHIDCPVTGRRVVLVDDVIFTGRTIRAAIDGIFALGRPSAIQLAVLIDRGHRELPIRPDYVGKNIPTSRAELVAVNLPAYDGRTSVEIYEQGEK